MMLLMAACIFSFHFFVFSSEVFFMFTSRQLMIATRSLSLKPALFETILLLESYCYGCFKAPAFVIRRHKFALKPTLCCSGFDWLPVCLSSKQNSCNFSIVYLSINQWLHFGKLLLSKLFLLQIGSNESGCANKLWMAPAVEILLGTRHWWLRCTVCWISIHIWVWISGGLSETGHHTPHRQMLPVSHGCFAGQLLKEAVHCKRNCRNWSFWFKVINISLQFF